MTAVPAEIALAKRPMLKDAGLWLGAGMVVLFAHAASAYLLRDLAPLPDHDAMEQAMEIDLAPLPVSVPEAVRSEAVAREQPAETVEPVEETEAVQPEPEQAVETSTETEQRILPEPAAVEPVAEEAEPKPVETAEAVPDELEPVPVETVEAVTPEVTIPLPEPRPERRVEEKPEPQKKPVRKKVETADKKIKETKQTQSKSAPASQRASAASSAPTVDPSRWNSAVRAAIARRAGAVRGMRGTVRVSFVVNSSGAIVSASVSGSSGNARLDQAALRMVRAARVPAPPAGIGGARHAFAIPLSFR